MDPIDQESDGRLSHLLEILTCADKRTLEDIAHAMDIEGRHHDGFLAGSRIVDSGGVMVFWLVISWL